VVDFFVSYTGADVGWAEWVAWVLEDAGYSTRVQAWDFVAGSHFVTEMHRAAQDAARTVAVLSASYLSCAYAEAQWQAAWDADPSGRDHKLLVVRVDSCALPGLLGQLVTVDLFGVARDVAAGRLLAGARGKRGKPAAEPVFPGTPLPPTEVGPGFPGHLPAVWNVPGRNRHFAGRDGVLAELRGWLAGKVTVLVPALSWMGGVGKTQLALEYAWRYAADYQLVWWVAAEEPELVGGQLAALATRLGLPDLDADLPVVATVADALRYRRGWLLVFDDVSRPEDVRPFLFGDPGHVLITSRQCGGWAGLAGKLPVGLFDRAESVALLRDRAGWLGEADADRVAAALGDLPLAVDQAAGFLGETSIPIGQYLELLEAQRLAAVVGRDNKSIAVDARGAQGVQSGDHNVQNITFNTPPSNRMPTSKKAARDAKRGTG
jgi:hypothetical protein